MDNSPFVQFLSQELPFKLIATQEIPDKNIAPATDQRPLDDQNQQEFFVTAVMALMHFSTESGSWSIKNRTGIDKLDYDHVSLCFVLPNQSILAAMGRQFSFFSFKLEHTHDVSLSNVVDGLKRIK